MPDNRTPTEVQADIIADLEARLQLAAQRDFRQAAEIARLRCGIVVERGKLVQFPAVSPSREFLNR